MDRHRASFRIVFWLAAGCWLAAGPGAGVLRAALACRDAAMPMQSGDMSGGAPMPQGGPCFCTQMTGAFDQALSAAMPAVEPPGGWVVVPVVAVTGASRVVVPPSPPLDLETPPPIAA